MGRSCTICSDDRRDEIERRIVAGEPIRAIARHLEVGKDALARHAASHLPSTLMGLREAGQELQAARALDRLEELFAEGREVLAAARREGRHQMSLSAIREMRGLIELIARLTGELDDRPVVAVDLTVSPEWLAVQAAVLRALKPHPEARLAVTQALAPLAAAPS